MKNKKEFTLRNMYCNRKAKRQIKRIMSHFLIFPPIILNFCLAQLGGSLANQTNSCALRGAKQKFSIIIVVLLRCTAALTLHVRRRAPNSPSACGHSVGVR